MQQLLALASDLSTDTTPGKLLAFATTMAILGSTPSMRVWRILGQSATAAAKWLQPLLLGWVGHGHPFFRSSKLVRASAYLDIVFNVLMGSAATLGVLPVVILAPMHPEALASTPTGLPMIAVLILGWACVMRIALTGCLKALDEIRQGRMLTRWKLS